MYTDVSKSTPLYTHISLYVAWRVHPLGNLTLKVDIPLFGG